MFISRLGGGKIATERPKKENRLTCERLMKELSQIALSDYSDFVEIVEEEGKEGEIRPRLRLRPTGKIPKSKRAAIASIRQAPGGIEVKLHDKLQALKELSRLLEGRREKEEREAVVQIIDDI